MQNRGSGPKRVLAAAVLLAFLCAAFSAFAWSYTVEEDGSIWYDDGRIEWPDGTVTQQVNHDQGQTHDDDGGSSSYEGSSGSGGAMVIDTGEADPLAGAQQNTDGSITVESGTMGIDIEEDEPRAPLEGEEWQAVLDSVASRNGNYTPTVYADPYSGTVTEVQVVYMGIGRSMVVLDGQQILVNTVDLKWETEAPEDKVLAVVDAPRVGYAWLRKKPNNKKTNPKIAQIRTDTVLRVISAGENYSLVDYDGMRAYVQSSALEFFRNDHVVFDAGVVTVKGKAKGKETVHVRSRDKGCRDLGEYLQGTPITVFDIVDEWAEVDICGWHCRILTKYVTLEKELTSLR